MATVKKNVITQGLSGMLGGTIVFRNYGDRTIVSTAPTHNGHPPSAAQQAHRQRFQEATIYAKAQMQDPTLKAEYEAAGEHQHITAYAVAVKDFMQAPDIQDIDLNGYAGNIGDLINVHVTDGFKVTAVQVTITNGDGTLVESGDAVQQSNSLNWQYAATKKNTSLTGDKITVKAFDLPGHHTDEERTL